MDITLTFNKVIDSGCLFTYFSPDDLIMLHLTSKVIQIRLNSKEVLYRIHTNWNLEQEFNIKNSVLQLVEYYDLQNISCRTVVVQQFLLDGFFKSRSKKDYNSSRVYGAIGCNCGPWIRRDLTIKSLDEILQSTKFMGYFEEREVNDKPQTRFHVEIQGIRWSINYREVIFLLRRQTSIDISELKSAPLTREILPALFSCQDRCTIGKIIGDDRINCVNVATSLGYNAMLLIAKICSFSPNKLITIM